MAIEDNSKIGLLSKALILCGETPLTSLSDNRYGATVGGALFEIIYENEIQSNAWRFATTKAALSQLVNVPLNQWQFAYQLPADMLVPVGVYPHDTSYEIYGDKLFSNRTTVELDYRFKPEVTEVPAYFALLMTFALARVMINPITESTRATDRMNVLYDAQRAIAMYADAQGRPAKPVAHSPFTAVRN